MHYEMAWRPSGKIGSGHGVASVKVSVERETINEPFGLLLPSILAQISSLGGL